MSRGPRQAFDGRPILPAPVFLSLALGAAGTLAGLPASFAIPAAKAVPAPVVETAAVARTGGLGLDRFVSLRQLNLELKRLFDLEGIEFAFPTRTIHVKQAP